MKVNDLISDSHCQQSLPYSGTLLGKGILCLPENELSLPSLNFYCPDKCAYEFLEISYSLNSGCDSQVTFPSSRPYYPLFSNTSEEKGEEAPCFLIWHNTTD